MNEVYKLKQTGSGGLKVIVKDDSFNPPIEVLDSNFEKISRYV